jgi:hypothetical protein
MRGVKISKETAEEVRKVLAKARAERKANYAKIKATKKETTKASDKKGTAENPLKLKEYLKKQGIKAKGKSKK